MRKTVLTTIVTLETSIVLFKGNFSSQLNLIFIYFLSYSSEILVIDPIKSLILLHSSSYFLIFSLLSLAGTSVKYSFPLISSKYPFTFLK